MRRTKVRLSAVAVMGLFLLHDQAAWAGVVTGSTVGYWTFDSYNETGSNPAGVPQGTHEGYYEDQSGNDQNAYVALVDNKDYVPMDAGKFGNSLYSCGINNSNNSMCAVVQNTDAITFNQENFTISFWEKVQYRDVAGSGWGDGRGRTHWFMKAPYLSDDGNASTPPVVKGLGLNLTQNHFDVLGNKEDDNFGQEILDGGRYTYPTGSAADDSNQWCHWAVTGTYDGGSNNYEVIVYKNGQAVDWNGGQDTTLTISNDIIHNDGDLSLGCFYRNNDRAHQRSLHFNMRDQSAGQTDSKGWLDDFAMLTIDFTAGEAAGTVSLGNNAELAYSMAEVAQLYDVYRDMSGAAVIGDRKWTYATGLGGDDGELVGSGNDFTLVLDSATGTGLLCTIAAVPGDTNGDEMVDTADYIALKQNLGSGPGAGLEDGDVADGTGEAGQDGYVNWLDLDLMAEALNASPGGAVPEPASVTLLALGAGWLLRRRVRRRG